MMATYSCRAECRVDVQSLLAVASCEAVRIEPLAAWATDLPDAVAVEFRSALDLPALQALIEGFVDPCHVILDTLRACSLSENDFERDYEEGEN